MPRQKIDGSFDVDTYSIKNTRDFKITLLLEKELVDFSIFMKPWQLLNPKFRFLYVSAIRACIPAYCFKDTVHVALIY